MTSTRPAAISSSASRCLATAWTVVCHHLETTRCFRRRPRRAIPNRQHLSGQSDKVAANRAERSQACCNRTADESGPSGPAEYKLDRVKDKSFWSARVNDDLRLILHRTEASCLLCYVGHHDPAYAWAERRKLTVHPKTGAAQMVVLKETVQEIVVHHYVAEATPRAEAPKRKDQLLPLLAGASDEELLAYGVPEDWLDTVRKATEETVLDLVVDLPEEAHEAVLSLATGIRPATAPVVARALAQDQPTAKTESAAFAHPDAQRRFRTVADLDELQAALDAPWEKWAVFLHPAQRALVDRDFNGPARVTGSAGTGKTIVALHRAVHLAQSNPSARVLLTTFSDVLAKALENKLRLLIANRPRLGEQIEVLPFEAVAKRLYASDLETLHGPMKLATRDIIVSHIRTAVAAEPRCLSANAFSYPSGRRWSTRHSSNPGSRTATTTAWDAGRAFGNRSGRSSGR